MSPGTVQFSTVPYSTVDSSDRIPYDNNNSFPYRGLEIFKIFCKIDVDESETLEVEECMNYFGGKRTKFTERLFGVLDGDVKGLDFVHFTFTVWSFCTLNVSGVARCVSDLVIFLLSLFLFSPNDHQSPSLPLSLPFRYVFEIFDPDNNFWLEQPDIEAIYRMLYDSNDHDTKHIQQIKFDDKGRISKEKFIKHFRSKKFILRPALDYQKRVRKMLGGQIGRASCRERV